MTISAAFASYVPAQDAPPNGSKDTHNPKKSANPNGLTVGKPKSLEVALATSTVWLRNNDRRWPRIAARYLAEKGKPLRAVVSVHGAGADIPTSWLV